MDKTLFAYNNCAPSYEAKFRKNETYMNHALNFSDYFTEGASILDIGCGPGLNSALFSSRKLSVTGLDFSEEMLILARKNCPEGEFINKSINEFETDKKFDGICLSFLIVHLEDEAVNILISRLSSMMLSRAKVYISFMTGKKAGYELSSFADNEIYYNYFDKNEIISMFKKNGFKLISSHSDPYKEADGSFTDDIFLIFELSDQF